MTDNKKKSALEQLREICASLDKVLENAPPNCEKPELEVTIGALHIACLLELAERVEALEKVNQVVVELLKPVLTFGPSDESKE